MTRIENWKQKTPGPTIGQGIQGFAYNSQRWADGEAMQTSPVVSVKGRVATTESGSDYELGTPLEWWTKVKDEDNPFGA